MPPRATDRDAVETAVDGLQRAEAAVTEAERARDEADAALDRALAARGWNRSYGGFNAALYSHLTGSHLVPREQLLAALEAERRAA